MNRNIIIILTLLTAMAHNAMAQECHNIDSLIQAYRFGEAEAMLREISESLPLDTVDTKLNQQLTNIKNARAAITSVERVTFLDSVQVPKSEFLKHITLSADCGTLTSTRAMQGDASIPAVCSTYIPEMADRRYYARPDASGAMHLVADYKMGSKWGDLTQLRGIPTEEGASQINPFMTTDGTTLYYAAQGSKGIGGYDIYRTRYDADEKRYLAPENIGMPFNSPANEYLYAVDEEHHIGWFVTDRGIPDSLDAVTIYTFIPNDVRNIYNTAIYSEDEIISMARIDDIQQTWANREVIKQKLASLNELRAHASLAATQQQEQAANMNFAINETTTYTQLAQFRNAEARQMFDWWTEGQRDLTAKEKQLTGLRQRYATANDSERGKLRDTILALEAETLQLTTQLKQQEKEIRKLENK